MIFHAKSDTFLAYWRLRFSAEIEVFSNMLGETKSSMLGKKRSIKMELFEPTKNGGQLAR